MEIDYFQSEKDSDYLLKYISKNTYIPHFLSTLDSKNPKVKELRTAIEKGDENAEIFKDPDCYLYLIYLMKTEKNFSELGLTTYVYLMTLMQFSDHQPLRMEDSLIKFRHNFSIQKISQNGVITFEGAIFLRSIHARIIDQGHILDYAQLENYVLTLPPTEQWLIKITYRSPGSIGLTDAEVLLDILLINIPFCTYENAYESLRSTLIPSASVIQYILQKITPSPMRLVPIFGTINEETLRQWHSFDRHPGALYGLHVLSNIRKVHHYISGPLIAYLHDVGHLYWGSLLSKAERQYIYDEFIPQMETLLSTAQDHFDLEVVHKIKNIIFKSIDFDLTDIRSYSKENRFIEYISRLFGKYANEKLFPREQIEFEPMGIPMQDRLYFLLYKMRHQLPLGKNKKFWDSVFAQIKVGKNYREITVIQALEELAKYNNQPLKKESVFADLQLDRASCESWLYIFDPAKTHAEVWESIRKEKREYQFLHFTKIGHIAFLPPYLPLTDASRNEFVAFIKGYQAKLDNSLGADSESATMMKRMTR